MADAIKIMSRLGVDYTQAIKSAEQLAASLSSVDKQLKQLKLEYALTAGQLNKAFRTSTLDKVIYDQLGRPLMEMPKTAEKVFDDTGKIINEGNKKISRQAETFWQRRVGWFIAGTAFYGGLQALRDTIKTIGDVEMGMTQIARVTEDTNFSFAGMRDELFKLGQEYGMTFDKVQDIALRWAQAGYNMKDTLELTRDSLLALNTAELDAEQATSGLIAIMAQWGLTADQLLPVIDKINKVADDFAITSEDLVTGLTRSGGAAKVLGLTLEQTIAILTVMREATGRTGKEVGNALNSILSFMQRPKTIETFEKEGIKVWADETKTAFRNVIDIFNELAQRWPQMSQATQDMFVESAQQAGLYTEEIAELAGVTQEFTAAQQRDLSQAAAGIYRRNYLLALLQNWSKIDQVLIAQEQALGYSVKENQRTMETYQKKVEQLRATYQQLQVAIGESGLLDNLKLATDILTDAVEWLNKADPAVKSFVINLGLLGGALTAIHTTLNVMGGVQVLKMGGALAKQIEAAQKAATGLKASLAGISVFLKANWPVFAITGGLTVLLTVINQINQQNQKMREQASTAAQLLDQYEQAQGRLDKLTEGTKEYAEASRQLHSIQLDILSQFPKLWKDGGLDVEGLRAIATSFDDIGKSVKQGVTVIEQYNQEMDSLTEETSKLERNKSLLSDLVKKHNELSNALAKEKAGTEEAAQKKEELAQIQQGIIAVVGEEGLKRLEAAGYTREAVNREIEAINKQIEAKNKQRQATIENEKAMTKTMIQEAITRMNAALLEAQAMAERAQALRQSWMTNDSNLLNMTQFIESGSLEPRRGFLVKSIASIAGAEHQAQYYLNKAKEYQQIINRLQGHLDALNNVGKKSTGTASTAAKETGKLTDIIHSFIDAVMQAVDAIEELNTRRQEEVDLLEARASYFGRENASIASQIAALRDQTRIVKLAKEQQQGLHEENLKLAEANKKLQEQMKKVNTTTDEGRQAFRELSDQIEQNTQRIARNSVEWWKWQETITQGISGMEMVRAIREADIETLRSEIELLTREGATKEELNRADAIRTELLAKLNEKLADNEQRIKELEEQGRRLTEELKNGTNAEGLYYQAIKDTHDKVEQLKRSSNDLRREIADLGRQTYVSANEFKRASQSLDHFAKMGILSVQEQIRELRRLSQIRGLSAEEQWQIDERLFEHYKDLLNDQKKDIEEAYKERLRLLEESTDAQIAEIQRLIDALSQEATDEEREEAERQHNQKIADLLKERYYHEIRTGLEHQRRIEEIDREIAEENKRWQLEQNKWAREDKRKEYEKQIDEIRKQAEKQRKEWEKAWARLEDDFSDHNINMIAAAAAYDEDWYKDAKRKAERWFEGFKEGLPKDLVGDYLSDLVGDAEDYVRDRKDQDSHGSDDDGYDYYRDKAILDLKKLAEAAYAEGNRSLAESYRERADEIRKQGPTLDPHNTMTAAQLRQKMLAKYGKAHEGAYVLESGAAVLLKGERVLSPQLTVSFDRLANAVLSRNVPYQGDIEKVADRIISAIGRLSGVQIEKLLNIEHFEPRDDADIEILGRELVRNVNLFRTARGRL